MLSFGHARVEGVVLNSSRTRMRRLGTEPSPGIEGRRSGRQFLPAGPSRSRFGMEIRFSHTFLQRVLLRRGDHRLVGSARPDTSIKIRSGPASCKAKIGPVQPQRQGMLGIGANVQGPEKALYRASKSAQKGSKISSGFLGMPAIVTCLSTRAGTGACPYNFLPRLRFVRTPRAAALQRVLKP